MALIIYPTENYDSFISLVDALDVISKNSVHSSKWIGLSDINKEIYLRIATTRILNIIDISLLNGIDSCLVNSCAMSAIRDIVYEISSEINPNIGLITKEKIGDLEVDYYQGFSSKVNSKNKNPFDYSIQKCLESYGAIFNNYFKTATLVHS